MRKRSVWLILSCLMVVSLVLASCAPAVVEEKEEEVVVRPPPAAALVEEKKEAVEEKEVAAAEVPKYGGTLRFSYLPEPQGFDSTHYSDARVWAGHFTNNELITADWTKGPAGTNEYPMLKVLMINTEYPKGKLATSWEVPDPNTIIWHIRQGVYWQDKPPVNGRMLTAKDVARYITYNMTVATPPGYVLSIFRDWFVSAEVDPDDEWTVIVKCKDSPQYRTAEAMWWMGQYGQILSMDAIELYGGLGDWRKAVGTGPFYLVDFVPETSIRFVRNPNYWDKDPVGPGKGNQLPYVDAIKGIMIIDASTALAALRTAQIDVSATHGVQSHTLSWEDAKSLMKTHPQLLWKPGFTKSAFAIGLRIDQPQLPTYKKDVRRALMMAVDLQTIRDTYFDGAAELRSMPLTPLYPSSWIPLEELPESVRELYEYHPDKARELLAKAGYPDGFQINVLARNYPDEIDQLAIIKEYWADIGVTMSLDIREYAVVRSLQYTRPLGSGYSTGLMVETVGSNPDRMGYYQPGQGSNVAFFDDPAGNELRGEIFKWENIGKDVAALQKAAAVYFIETASWLVLPAPYQYHFWWPWLKNYHGEEQIGYGNYFGWMEYVWIDQDLKKAMGY